MPPKNEEKMKMKIIWATQKNKKQKEIKGLLLQENTSLNVIGLIGKSYVCE